MLYYAFAYLRMACIGSMLGRDYNCCNFCGLAILIPNTYLCLAIRPKKVQRTIPAYLTQTAG